MVETILSVSTETSIAQLDCYSCPSVRLSPSPASAPISAKPARPHQEIFLAIRKVLETNPFFFTHARLVTFAPILTPTSGCSLYGDYFPHP